MVSAINFAVRDSAGGRQLGTIAGEGEGNFIQVGAGDHISLNLSSSSVMAYEQQGRDLVIQLADGRVIVLAGYFDAPDAQVYLSADGSIVPVDFTGDGSGILTAQYGQVQGFEKWSPLDDLRFDTQDMVAASGAVSDDPATMGMFAPALLAGGTGLGAVGAGVLGLGLLGGDGGGGGGGDTGTGGGDTGTGGGGGGDTGTGGGGGGDTGTGGGGGGDTGTGGGGGGDTGTGGGGGGDTGTGGGGSVDVTVTEGTGSAGHVENLEDYNNGVTIGGEGDVGATITVVIDGHTQTTTVGTDGTWTVTFPTTDLAGGERTTAVTVTATNSSGASTTVTDTLVLDTIPHPIGISPVTTDNTISGAEQTAGFSIGGTTTAGAVVTLVIDNNAYTATAGADGTWSVPFAPGELAAGTYEATVSASTVDAAGNTSSSTRTFNVDTQVSVAFAPDPIEGENVVNLAEASDGVTMTGTADAGSTVVVNWGGSSVTATVSANGSWTANFPAGSIPADGTTTATVTATDAVGNTSTATRSILVDTTPNPISISPVTTDNTVSQSEFNAGFTIGGTTAAGATVTLSIAGVTQTVVAEADGTWSVVFPQGSIAGGTYQATVTASTTDAAGNPSSSTRTFNVDTEVTVAFAPDPIEGDNIVNMVETAGGVTMNGTSQAGSVVTVQWGETTLNATTDAQGNWTVNFPNSAIPLDGVTTATVRATDSVGNTSSATRTITVDTETSVTLNPVAGNDEISGLERTAGAQISGHAEANASIVVEFDGVTRTTTADAGGNWTVTYGASDIRSGFYEAGLNVRATDPAGNVATDARMVFVDTETFVDIDAGQVGGDNVISGAERSAGITLTGTSEPSASIEVTFAGTTRTVTANSSGQWSVNYSTSEIPSGTTTANVAVRATDLLGNTATATHTVNVDTEVVPLTRESLGAGSDNVINAVEAAGGVTITGTVEAGSSVRVQFGSGQPIDATVAPNGSWSVNIPEGDIPMGESSARLTVTATDRVGNTRTHSEDVMVDRVVRSFGPSQANLSGDGYLNAEEAAQGLTVNGTAEPGANVVVRIAGGGTMTVTADANGNWSTIFSGANLPRGELETTVSVTATDLAGNVSSYSQPLIIDTIAPGAPDVMQFTRNALGLTRIETDEITDTYDFTRVDQNGNVAHMDAVRTVDEVFGTQNVSFGSFSSGHFNSTPVPDGSYLVVNTTDLAGNESSTLLVVNNTNAPHVDLSRPGLSNFDLSAVDLTFAPDAELTITEAQILSLTGPDHTLVVKGGVDDRVSLVNATATGNSQEIDGETYNIYTVGSSGATVLLDDDITVV